MKPATRSRCTPMIIKYIAACEFYITIQYNCKDDGMEKNQASGPSRLQFELKLCSGCGWILNTMETDKEDMTEEQRYTEDMYYHYLYYYHGDACEERRKCFVRACNDGFKMASWMEIPEKHTYMMCTGCNREYWIYDVCEDHLYFNVRCVPQMIFSLQTRANILYKTMST